MQQTPYNVLVLRDTPDTTNIGETNTTIALAPQLILATSPAIARDKAIRALTDDAAQNLDQLRVIVQEVSGNVPARW